MLDRAMYSDGDARRCTSPRSRPDRRTRCHHWRLTNYCSYQLVWQKEGK